MPKNETKRDKFIRIAEARTNKIIDMVQLLGNCSNTATYSYTTDDVEKIFIAIEAEIKGARKRFNKAESKRGSRFSFEKE